MKINLTINGVAMTGNPGQTLLDVARENDVFIPTLCHDDRIKPFGSCLLCRVEVEGARGNMLACATPITEGMVVRTESAGISASRKTCLELLVSQHYGDCKAPCSMTCPAGIDVQGYIAHIANGQYYEAIKLVKERNPLPVVCGRICTRPCEDECRRNRVDERVGIDYLKRFISDVDLNSEQPYIPPVAGKTGKKVAIIGAGPGGLSCAYYLAILGHEVTIFERWPHGGGMLRFGIPAYRLPRHVLDKEIDIIKALGVEIRYNTTFGKDITHADLQKEGYQSLFLAVGSQVGQALGLPNENLEGVMSGVDFLGKVSLGENIDFTGKKVVVIGGGNTAVDAARTSIRLNAADVVMAYRRTREEIPAHKMEIEEAEFENVRLELLIAPKGIVANGNQISGVRFMRMRLGEPDASGRRSPEEIPGSEFIMDADIVIGAIGQSQDLSFINEAFPVKAERGRIVADKNVMTTSVEGVFAGGDAVTGPRTAIEAIAAGRKAAYAIQQYLYGEPITKLPEMYNHTKGKLYEIDAAEFEGYEKIPKLKMPMLCKEDRCMRFDEVELGFTEEQARQEASRCLSCGCKDVYECKLREYATAFDADQYRLEGEITIHPIDDTHPYITRDPNKCIMCGRCVRICMEQQGAGVLGFVTRGYNTTITPSFDVPFGEDKRCEKCGQCVSTCPVGALTEKVQLPKPGPFFEKATETICGGCGTGCTLELQASGDMLQRITAQVGVGVNNGNLCEKGKFISIEKQSKDRVTQPLIQKEGVLQPTSWDEAYAHIANRLKAADAKADIFASPEMTNEGLSSIKKLGAFRTLYTSKGAAGLQKAIGKSYGEATYADITAADLIVCVGFDIKKDNPVAALIVKKAVDNGCKLIAVDKTSDDASLAEAFKNAKAPLMILGDETAVEAAEAAGHFVIKAGSSAKNILLMHSHCNMRGMLELGVHTTTPAADLKAAILFGEDIADQLKDVAFKVVCTSNLTETAKKAQVVLPLASFAEVDGTYTNSEGRIQQVHAAFTPAMDSNAAQIVEKLSQILSI